MKYLKLLLTRTFEECSKHDAPMLGAALAYYSVLSLAPLLVVAMAIAGVVFRREIVQQRVLEQVISVIGCSGADAIRTMLGSVQSQKAGVAGFVVLLFSAAAVFNALRKAVNQTWGVKPDQSSTWWEVIKDQMNLARYGCRNWLFAFGFRSCRQRLWASGPVYCPFPSCNPCRNWWECRFDHWHDDSICHPLPIRSRRDSSIALPLARIVSYLAPVYFRKIAP